MKKGFGIFLGRKILQKKRNDGYFHPTGSFCSYAELIRCFISNSLRAINPDAASSLLDKNGIISVEERSTRLIFSRYNAVVQDENLIFNKPNLLTPNRSQIIVQDENIPSILLPTYKQSVRIIVEFLSF